MLVLKLKRGKELKRKTKVKVWKDVDEVVKATTEIPKKVQWIVQVMEEVPKGERHLGNRCLLFYLKRRWNFEFNHKTRNIRTEAS